MIKSYHFFVTIIQYNLVKERLVKCKSKAKEKKYHIILIIVNKNKI